MRNSSSLGRFGAAGLMSFVLLTGILGSLFVSTVGSSQAVAQDPAEPAADPAAQAPKAPESQLAFYYGALGLFYTVVFLAMSFVLVALLVMNILGARRQSVLPLHLIEGFESHLKEKRYQEAYEMAKNDESFLGKVLAAGLGRLSSGYEQALEAMQEVGEEETMKLDHRLSYVALIGALAPMVGLLGTVDGMVASFQVIAASPTTPKPSELAAGISTALITTLVGLWIAIPAITIYNIIKNRLARLVLEVGALTEGMMGRFQNVGKKA